MKRLMIAMMCLGVAGYVSAQEAETAPAEETAPAGEAVGADGGVQALEEAQEGEPAPAEAESPTASDVLQKLMEKKGWNEGWDNEKGRIIVVQSADFNIKDPKKEPEKLFLLREAAVKRAVLQAKAQIIEMINTQMSASEKFDMPGTDVNKELDAESEKVQQAMAEQQALMASLLEKTDKAEADMLRGTTFGQRLDDALAATIKKLDAEYDAGKHDAAAKARYEEMKKKYEAASKEFTALKEKAEKLQANLQSRQESAVATMAKMPLYGTAVMLQTESWDDESGMYEVAVMLTWSKALERSARAIVTGEDYRCKPGKSSVHTWLAKQNLATLLGPRQFVDDKGDRWFLAATARPMSKKWPSSKRTKMKGLSEMFAKQMAAFCVYGDVESYKKAQQIVEERGDGENESEYMTAESMAQNLSSTFKNKTVRGLQKLKSAEVVHPVTGDRVFVAVYGLNSSAAAAALEVEKINYATKVMDNRHQTVERGRRAANEASVKASENRTEDFQKGTSEQSTAIQKELSSRKPAPTKGVSVIKKKGVKPAPSAKKNTAGVFSGDADVDDDF